MEFAKLKKQQANKSSSLPTLDAQILTQGGFVRAKSGIKSGISGSRQLQFVTFLG